MKSNRPLILNVESLDYKSALIEKFLQLTSAGYTLTAASHMLGRPPSYFSGKKSILRRHHEEGTAGVLPKPREYSAAARCELTRKIEATGWFVRAARYFYLNAPGRRASVSAAVRLVMNLPALPPGWSAATRERFRRHLGYDQLPQCPPGLRQDLERRAASRRPLVPERIARTIAGVPAESGRRVYEAKLKPNQWSEQLNRFIQEQAANASLKVTIEVIDTSKRPSEHQGGVTLPGCSVDASYPSAKLGGSHLNTNLS